MGQQKIESGPTLRLHGRHVCGATCIKVLERTEIKTRLHTYKIWCMTCTEYADIYILHFQEMLTTTPNTVLSYFTIVREPLYNSTKKKKKV